MFRCSNNHTVSFSDLGVEILDNSRFLSNTIEDNATRKGFRSGTTVAMVVLTDDAMRTVHVGDSRVYMLQNKKLSRLTTDHSEVQRLFSMGLITEAEMETHPKRHAISQFLGMPRDDAAVAPTISKPIQLSPGMRILICSDGLTDMVKDPELQEILSQSKDAEEAVKRCITTALHNGGKDNVTAICLFVGSGKRHISPVRKASLMLGISCVGLLVSIGLIVSSLIQMLG